MGTIFGTGPWNTQIGLADQTLTCCVPQGSVFGPLLWNLAYNPPHRPSCRLQLVYYADDTLIVAGGEIGLVVTMRAEIVEKMRRIREIGLEMTLNKWRFSSSTMREPSVHGCHLLHINVESVRVEMDLKLKYLGLILDELWKFVQHFETIIPRADKNVHAGTYLAQPWWSGCQG